MLHELLRREALMVNRKRMYRLYCDLGMQVRTKKRKKQVRSRILLKVPTWATQRWSLDFLHDQLSNGRRLKVLNIVDDYSRVCGGQLVDLSISGERMARHLDEIDGMRGLPRRIVMDNGPEMTRKAMFMWSQQTGVKLHFIQPGKPAKNPFVESFNGRFRDRCLRQQWFKTLADARSIIGSWQEHYNQVRPHSALNYRSPADYEKVA